MRDGPRWSVFSILVGILLAALVPASSQVGSDLTSSSPAPSPGSTECSADDRCILQKFKNGLQSRGALASWNTSNDLVNWTGVTWLLSAEGVPMAVEKLDLGQLKLVGTGICPLLCEGLPNLTVLNISGNNFTGELGTLRICPALKVLDLSNNSFSGPLPAVVNCDNTSSGSSPLGLDAASFVNIQVFNLSKNGFTGSFPGSLLITLPSLQSLSLSSNNLRGQMPDELGSLRNLSSIDLSGNQFVGNISLFLGNCTELKELQISSNNFSGEVPFDVLGRLPKLAILDASNNVIKGRLAIPTEEGSFSALTSLALSSNLISGNIPENLGNLSSLESLVLKYNSLNGVIPSSLARLSRLQVLSLQYNNLNGTIPLEFSELNNLSILSVNRNKLTGTISSGLANCTNLRSLWLNQNYLGGAIPPELGNLTNLVVLSLYGNYFNETIPVEVGNLGQLVAFDFSWNKLHGAIPTSLCDLHNLQVLLLNNNWFSGVIPNCVGNYSQLRILDMSFNNLSGSIPNEFVHLDALRGAESQRLPDELSAATYIQQLEGQDLVWEFSESPTLIWITNNFLTGEIPSSFGLLQKLQQLRLSHNFLSGPIPGLLGNASALFFLDLSDNKLDGSIPSELTELTFLSTLNLSYNNLVGRIPYASQFLTFTSASFLGNPGLCGFPLDECLTAPPPLSAYSSYGMWKRPVSRRLLPLYIILSSAVVCFFFLGVLFSWGWIRGYCRRNSSLVSSTGELCENMDDPQCFHVTISSTLPSLSPKELAHATENYNENNIIGDGGFGLVYRAVLKDGSVVAVKKLIEAGEQGQNEFLAEMRTLGKIKHRNLVCLLGYCSYGKERILVYDYMKNGSLDSWLHCRDEGVAGLDWGTLLKIARGAAEGLAFLHHGLNPAIIHRDIKASNILLDCDFEARLCDFGLARSTKFYDDSHVSTDFAGTAGYIPPEYSQATTATTKGDVYSFGVVLLEILTGRRPTDPFFRKKDMAHVVSWVLDLDLSSEGALEKTFHLGFSASADQTLELMRIARMCCNEAPSKRPKMGVVVQKLESLERQQSPSRSPSVVLYDNAMTSPRCR